MTSPGSPSATLAPAALALEGPFAPSDPAAVAALNRTHDMAGMRARGGLVVHGIERRRRRMVVGRVLRCAPRVVVDVGCEDGWLAEGFAPRVEETVLVDLDPAVLERARARRLPRTRCLLGDAAGPPPVGPASADVVVLSAVLEHLSDPAGALSAWAPVLRPGGRFVVFVPADRPILLAKRILRRTGLSGLVRGVSLEPAPGHVRTFDRRSLASLLRPHGVLEEVELDPVVLGYAATVRVP